MKSSVCLHFKVSEWFKQERTEDNIAPPHLALPLPTDKWDPICSWPIHGTSAAQSSCWNTATEKLAKTLRKYYYACSIHECNWTALIIVHYNIHLTRNKYLTYGAPEVPKRECFFIYLAKCIILWAQFINLFAHFVIFAHGSCLVCTKYFSCLHNVLSCPYRVVQNSLRVMGIIFFIINEQFLPHNTFAYFLVRLTQG